MLVDQRCDLLSTASFIDGHSVMEQKAPRVENFSCLLDLKADVKCSQIDSPQVISDTALDLEIQGRADAFQLPLRDDSFAV